MLRITEGRSEKNRVVLQLEGQLIGPWVIELDRYCEESAAQGHHLSIDLTALTFADRLGITLLRNLRGRGTSVINGSPYLREQLNEK